MYAITVKNMGVKFKLRHKKSTTLMETVVNLLTRRHSHNPSYTSKNETFWAVRNISFSVKEGEFFAVIGRNGAGKSTLLQILTGIYKPDEGTVETQGRLGLLQLGTGFHPQLPGRDNIYLNGAILGLRKKEIDAIYDSIVAFSELEQFIDMPIKNYSSGMKARLGFAIAINIRPDILLIDEVLSVGDEGFKKKSRQKLDELRDMGKTVVFVSHAMGEVRNLCDRAICLNRGQMVFEGTSAEAVRFYRNQILKQGAAKAGE
jgi:ABC-type polysaccharide/polyol phosphate transport system ATPase subunit